MHIEFKGVVKEIAALKSNSTLIHSETRSANELLKQRMEFIEWRLNLEVKASPKNKIDHKK
ncbi:hypothetical protein ACFSSE_12085 [Pedobacter alpinus]|uniref:Uncharacterized protein n=1 Tax=Pedobacter alpinus TaxID=1590643 RepID=A0ABW5TVA1_9SPHI